ncbi:MAG TPA: Fic family protein [Mycobacterium sp.]|nr:Fic family protein [Mycobacterium sp.]
MVFIARGDVDPITAAAVAHAQFETIHPFADGNGRIGRVIIGWMLQEPPSHAGTVCADHRRRRHSFPSAETRSGTPYVRSQR